MKIKNSGSIKLKYINDYPDGKLIISEIKKNLKFNPKRIYWITEFFSNAIRGKHAHRKTEQIIFCLKGSFNLFLDDGKNKKKIIMNNPAVGIKVGKLLWHTMNHFSKNCVILVLANTYYKESDYIRNYKEFLKHVE